MHVHTSLTHIHTNKFIAILRSATCIFREMTRTISVSAGNAYPRNSKTSHMINQMMHATLLGYHIWG